jgi:hypothetical protein
MKTIILPTLAFSIMASAAFAAEPVTSAIIHRTPTTLTAAQMDQVSAGALVNVGNVGANVGANVNVLGNRNNQTNNNNNDQHTGNQR